MLAPQINCKLHGEGEHVCSVHYYIVNIYHSFWHTARQDKYHVSLKLMVFILLQVRSKYGFS